MTLDLRGHRFGALVAIERRGTMRRAAAWFCRCECGRETLVTSHDLRDGNTKSCGCRATVVKHGDARAHRRTPEYRTWERMIQRCTNPRHPRFKDWGGRGIRVCDRWRHDYAAFLADMGRRPSATHSIDRIDNDGHYEPGNCRWATSAQQGANKRTAA